MRQRQVSPWSLVEAGHVSSIVRRESSRRGAGENRMKFPYFRVPRQFCPLFSTVYTNIAGRLFYFFFILFLPLLFLFMYQRFSLLSSHGRSASRREWKVFHRGKHKKINKNSEKDGRGWGVGGIGKGQNYTTLVNFIRNTRAFTATVSISGESRSSTQSARNAHLVFYIGTVNTYMCTCIYMCVRARELLGWNQDTTRMQNFYPSIHIKWYYICTVLRYINLTLWAYHQFYLNTRETWKIISGAYARNFMFATASNSTQVLLRGNSQEN